MTGQEVRRRYIEFFEKRGHQQIPRASLVPQNDPSTLFTGSGMQPMVPYLLGQPHPEGNRIVNSQTCLRAEDMDEVGDNRHTTFFEMLGNWSLGNYFKQKQLQWFWQFLVDEVSLDPQKLYVTCFIGDQETGVAKDTEAAEIWQKLFKDKGIKAKTIDVGSEEDGYKTNHLADKKTRIFYYDAKKNWWSRAGVPANMPEGEPGGPDSEVFYDFGTPHDEKWGEFCHPNCDCGRFLEIGNNVFMAYKKTANGFEVLPKPNIDFGGGLERIAAAAINNPDMFRISLLWPIIEGLEKLSRKQYDEHQEAMRVIADHVRAAVFLATDGVMPSNNEQGYVVRRLLRRAIRFAFDLGIEQDLLKQVVPIVADLYKTDFEEVAQAEKQIQEAFEREEKLFRQTLQRGLKEFDKAYPADGSRGIITRSTTPGTLIMTEPHYVQIDGEIIFKLYDTYGFPVELSIEEAKRKGILIPDYWEQEFNYLMDEQKKRSRTAGQGVFKGGLADHSEATTRLHTAHHLLLRALKDVLGDHVVQRGSNITAERLRIDFSHPEKVTREQLDEVEKIVNQKISEGLPVIRSEMPLQQAEKLNAEHEFGAKYPDTVSVYSVGPKDANQDNPMHEQAYSIEFCGGPHVNHTAELSDGNKKFKITKEEASSAGVRRIKAVLIQN
jgi:alanyl-tRNA synthetase